MYTSTALGGASKVSPVLHSACTLQVRQRSQGRECRTGLFVCGVSMQEVWKPIPGYEGRYEVSDQGRVRSLTRVVTYAASHKASAYSRSVKGQVLRPGPSNFGHLSVVLGRNNTCMVHTLVLSAFVGPRPAKHECRHLNGNPADNRLDNLVWGTRSENNIDAVAHGHRGKLTITQVQEIKEQLRNEVRGMQTKLAKQYKVSLCTINSIKFNRVYRHV